MNTKTKKIISLALLGATTSLMPRYGEHAYLYKDPRIMAMGGANVAVGGYSTSVFSNPAGLASIKKEHGFVVDLLGIGVSSSEKTQTFVDDINTASDSGDDAEVVAVLQEYAGDYFHIGVDNYSALSKNSDAFAWSIGILAAADINYVTHANGSSNGGLLETSSRAYGGVVLGFAKPYHTKIGRLDVGLGLKYIQQTSYEGALGVSELTNGDDIGEQLQDKYEETSSGMGLDIGVKYYPLQESSWNPAIGLSVLNIGPMDMDDNYGGQPMTVNIGASISPDVDYVDKLVIAVDYVDLFEANKVRLYDYNDEGNVVKYTDYSESDVTKRLRLGVNVGLIDSTYFSTAISGGLYQGAYTAGIDLELTLLKLNFATYQEQVGTGSVDIPDRRYMAKLSIGW